MVACYVFRGKNTRTIVNQLFEKDSNNRAKRNFDIEQMSIANVHFLRRRERKSEAENIQPESVRVF